MKRSQKRFTLVELLVVIGIIAVLAGILLPTISVAIRKVRVSRAKTEMASLLAAIKMYESEYDLLPIEYDQTVDSAELTTDEYNKLIAILSQSDLSGNNFKTLGNLRKNKMLNVKKPGEYKDPWENDFHVVVDRNADDNISSDNVDGMVDGQDLLYNIIIWSNGPDGERNPSDGNSANKDNVYSIETNWKPGAGHVLR
jgi:prepilin-type N-terminal cleavage/methylation domain-containing protein